MKAFCYTWSTRLAIIAIVSALSTLPVKADLREGLVGLWLFDDGADKDIEDSSGNKNHGVLDNGAKAGQAGKFGDAVVTQPQKAVSVPITDSLNSLEKAMSLGGWFRIDEPSDTGHRRNASYLLEDQAGGEQNPDGWVFAVWTDAGGIGLAWGKKKVKPKVWTHIAGTYDGKMLSLYINGKLDVSVKKEGKISNPGNPLGLGKYGGETYVGGMDEVFLYDRALSTDELEAIMKSFEVAFAVESRSKLATCWASLKQADKTF
ncbi:MAG: LamG domain-containing protein [Candidatus Poribacteria bacterium]